MSVSGERLSAPTPVAIGATRGAPGVGEPTSASAAAWQALAGVYDPELCLDIVSLGLVYDVREERGGVTVAMTLTTPGCPASEALVELARAAVAAALVRQGAPSAVQVDLVFDPPWSPSMISEAGAERLGLRRGTERR